MQMMDTSRRFGKYELGSIFVPVTLHVFLDGFPIIIIICSALLVRRDS
jgi:hypothetical protein